MVAAVHVVKDISVTYWTAVHVGAMLDSVDETCLISQRLDCHLTVRFATLGTGSVHFLIACRLLPRLRHFRNRSMFVFSQQWLPTNASIVTGT